ncbi:hypothetical protein GCM10010321_49860 [Streptomyces chartreusis]|nr:hypothetical protein GCM10010321_49860 [Streptomyces chartreusis]
MSFREARCTWHGKTCTEPPLKVVRTRDGARWAACARAVRTIAPTHGARPRRLTRKDHPSACTTPIGQVTPVPRSLCCHEAREPDVGWVSPSSVQRGKEIVFNGVGVLLGQ